MTRILIMSAVLFATVLAHGTNSYGQTSQGDPSSQPVNPVIQWNRVLLTIVRTPGAQPATIHPTRSFAIMHLAIYDAVNSIEGTHSPYSIRLPGASPSASQDAAASEAAYEVLINLYPQFQATLSDQLQQLLALLPDGADKAAGIAIGQSVADAILTLRSNDGSDAQPGLFVPGNDPGDYQSTPPNFPTPQFTHWSQVTPFGLDRADQFRPGPPPDLTSERYAGVFNQVKSLGVINSTTATADQQAIGRFWNGAIQNYWNEITQTAALAHSLTTAQSARLFTLLNLSIADGVIAFYDAKYTYLFWRPVTAIRAADPAINPATAPDPNWLPENTNTAADPSYPGAHAVISAAGATTLTSFFDSDLFDYAATSETVPGVTRSFTRFSAAEEEASMSRIYAGQHFRSDQTAGQRLGRNVASFVFDHFLTPVQQDNALRTSRNKRIK